MNQMLYKKSDIDKTLKDYNGIIEDLSNGKKTFQLQKLKSATRFLDINGNSKSAYVDAINECNTNKALPIVHTDSFNYWCNLATKKYGLRVMDILKLKFGETIKLVLLHRNIGDYVDDVKSNTFDPTKTITNATYVHIKGLSGILLFTDINNVNYDFTFEINGTPYGSSYWTPIEFSNKADVNVDIKKCKIIGDMPSQTKNIKLKLDTYIGWRGPCVLLSDVQKNLPKKVKKYKNYWNDDFLPINPNLSA